MTAATCWLRCDWPCSCSGQAKMWKARFISFRVVLCCQGPCLMCSLWATRACTFRSQTGLALHSNNWQLCSLAERQGGMMTASLLYKGLDVVRSCHLLECPDNIWYLRLHCSHGLQRGSPGCYSWWSKEFGSRWHRPNCTRFCGWFRGMEDKYSWWDSSWQGHCTECPFQHVKMYLLERSKSRLLATKTLKWLYNQNVLWDPRNLLTCYKLNIKWIYHCVQPVIAHSGLERILFNQGIWCFRLVRGISKLSWKDSIDQKPTLLLSSVLLSWTEAESTSWTGFAGGREDPIAGLVFCAPSLGWVDLSVINGDIIVKDGKLLTLNLQVKTTHLKTLEWIRT